MKTFKLVNPIIKSDVIDDVFTGESTMDVAKSAFKLLAKYMVTTKSNRFLFTMEDMNTNKKYNFDGTKKVVKQGKAVLNIKKFNIQKAGGNKDIVNHFKNMNGGAKKKKIKRVSSSSISENLLKELSLDSNNINSINNSLYNFNIEKDDQSIFSQMSGSGDSPKRKSKRRKSKRRKSRSRSNSRSRSRSNSGSRKRSNSSSRKRSNSSPRKRSNSSSRKRSESNSKHSETYDQWLRRRYLFPANTYFFYDPVYYYLPDYTTYIFNRNVFIPNLYYSLYPYWTTILPWISS
tara:strand:- start:438 stop:1307 length:870 start_codon:yes stop_codon:yes gene_type:complete